MSLEQALTENTAAVRELIALLQAKATLAVAATGGEANLIRTPQPGGKTVLSTVPLEKTKDGKDGKDGKAGKPAAQAAADTPPADEAKAEPEVIDYEKVVGPKLMEVLKKGKRDTLLSLLGRFGAATGKDLKPEQYADVLKDADTILEALAMKEQG